MAGMSAERSAGFSDRVLDSQATFRAVMDAMARPGRIQRIASAVQGPSPLMPASAAVALTLCDQDTPVWCDAAMSASDVAQWLVFHTSAPMTLDPAQAAFALIGDAHALTTFETFAQGSADYPDRSTTLIIQIASLTDGPAITLRGPGIDGATTLNASLSPQFVNAFAANHALFPRGIDCVLVAEDALVALPRTTHLTPVGG